MKADLEALRSQAIADPRSEATFFAALLDARLFAHRPISDDSGRVRLLQFTRPDGLTVLPAFTSRARAEFAAGSGARVLEFVGRDLFLLTRGAVIMLDPNDESCTLFPEEIEMLLRQGRVPDVATVNVGDDGPYQIAADEAVPDQLAQSLRLILSGVPYIRAAYLFQRIVGSEAVATYLLALDVEPASAERAARAMAVGMQTSFALDAVIDILTYEKDLPPGLQSLNGFPLYVREMVIP